MFFHFIGRHWLLTIIAVVVWAIVTRKVVIDFCEKIISEVQPRKCHNKFLYSLWRTGVPAAILLILGFILVPLIYFPVRKHRKAKAREESAARDRAQRLRDLEAERVENEKTTQRMEWFAAHPPKLYYRTINGITAVVSPHHLQAHKVNTARMERNEQWTHTVLPPSQETYLFVNTKGVETIKVAFGPRQVEVYSGWLADLDDLVKKYNVELVEEPRLFVPYVNEMVIPLDQHRSSRKSLESTASVLIDLQAPCDLWPKWATVSNR